MPDNSDLLICGKGRLLHSGHDKNDMFVRKTEKPPEIRAVCIGISLVFACSYRNFLS
jgi:hypothetical protein